MTKTGQNKTSGSQLPDPRYYRPLSQLRLWPDNYNTGDVGLIVNSITVNGFRGALRLWQDDMILAGNHTALALMNIKTNGPIAASRRPKDIDYHWPPIGIIDVDGEWFIRYVDCSDMSYTQAKAFAIADNEIARQSTRDELKLVQMLTEIYHENESFGLSTGIDTDDLDAMIANLGDAIIQAGGTAGSDEQAAAEADELPDDPADALVEKWHTALGQVWEIPSKKAPGKTHRLLCVRSDEYDWGDYQIDLTLTDPPYGIDVAKVKKSSEDGSISGSKPVTIGTIREPHPYPFRGVKGRGCTKGVVGSNHLVDATLYRPVAGDDKPFDPEWLLLMGRSQIIFGGNYFASKLPDSRCWIVWDKNNTGFFADAELAWTSFKTGVKLYQHTWNGLVREGPRDVEGLRRVHPTQKPVGLFSRIIQDYAEEEDVIFDPYLGSGTTLMACELTGHEGIGAELEPAYVAVTLERLAKLGLEPRLCPDTMTGHIDDHSLEGDIE